jgi:hypothetical protein
MVAPQPTLEKGEKMKKIFVFLVLALSLVLTACGSAAPKAAPNPTAVPQLTVTPTTASANFPTGKFVSDKNANVYWQFNPDGTWDSHSSTGLPLEGTYTISGSTYTETYNNAMFTDSDNCNKSATYTWSFDGSRLTFKVLSDRCEVRNEWYTNSTFVLAK